MATPRDYVEFVMEQLSHIEFEMWYRPMFGEYCIYANDKPVLFVADSTVFVKRVESIEHLMEGAKVGEMYPGSKPYYLLDIDNRELTEAVVIVMERHTPVPKPRKSRKKRVLQG